MIGNRWRSGGGLLVAEVELNVVEGRGWELKVVVGVERG